MDYLDLLKERAQRFWELVRDDDLGAFFACQSCLLLAYAALAKRGIKAPIIDDLAYYVELLNKKLGEVPEELKDPKVADLAFACEADYVVPEEKARELVRFAERLREALLTLV